MAILDVFKRKKEEKEAKKKPPEDEVEKKVVKKAKKIVRKKKKISKTASRVLKEPHVTEKAAMLSEDNKYVFKIFPRTNKIQVKKAVESLYGVNVLSVNIINMPEKERRLGRIRGKRVGFKKAIVRIKKGQKIDILPT